MFDHVVEMEEHTESLTDALIGDAFNGLQSSRLYALKDFLAACRENDVFEAIAGDDPLSARELMDAADALVRDCETVLKRDGR